MIMTCRSKQQSF